MQPTPRQTITVNIQGMNCARCVHAITTAVNRLENVELKRATVGQIDVAITDHQSLADVISAIRDAGYESHPTTHPESANAPIAS
ncbi:MAG: heavy-metal-associated domain-containing protein [Phycisphaerales bacterium]|nr:heavy-metal-associated domain-containing protein [Phycisphaerales bacterium]